MNRAVKVFLVLITILIIGLLIAGKVEAVYSVKNLTGTKINVQQATNVGNQIITICTVIGSVVSVIVLIVIGLKYMMGSIEEKAEYKKSLMPYVIGAICVFAASTIASVLYNIGIHLGE